MEGTMKRSEGERDGERIDVMMKRGNRQWDKRDDRECDDERELRTGWGKMMEGSEKRGNREWNDKGRWKPRSREVTDDRM